jgi:hypothetical protein
MGILKKRLRQARDASVFRALNRPNGPIDPTDQLETEETVCAGRPARFQCRAFTPVCRTSSLPIEMEYHRIFIFEGIFS